MVKYELLDEKAEQLKADIAKMQKAYIDAYEDLPPSFYAFMNDTDYHELKQVDNLLMEAYLTWLEYFVSIVQLADTET